MVRAGFRTKKKIDLVTCFGLLLYEATKPLSRDLRGSTDWDRVAVEETLGCLSLISNDDHGSCLFDIMHFIVAEDFPF